MGEDNQIVTAIRQLASAFEGEGAVNEMAFDIGRLADSLETLAQCVRMDANGGQYFCISPDID